jgi:hypothetical protein
MLDQNELFHAVISILQAHSNRYHSGGVATELVRRGGFTDEFIATNARIKHATNARMKRLPRNLSAAVDSRIRFKTM